jgi:NADH:ubiquinone oxidoreductase subunit 3 (subunit A)
MLSNWLFIGLFFIIALLLPGVAIFLAGVLGPKKSNAAKRMIYECGIETVGEAKIQFRAQYYIFALVFLVFDVEAVFLFPWAVAYGQLGLFAVLEGLLFTLVLVGGLVYAWKKGALEWK